MAGNKAPLFQHVGAATLVYCRRDVALIAHFRQQTPVLFPVADVTGNAKTFEVGRLFDTVRSERFSLGRVSTWRLCWRRD